MLRVKSAGESGPGVCRWRVLSNGTDVQCLAVVFDRDFAGKDFWRFEDGLDGK